MLKRITAIFIALTSLVAMCLPVLASDTAVAAVPLTVFDGSTPGTTSGTINSTSGSVSASIALSSSGKGSVKSQQDTDSEDWYIYSNHGWLMLNYKQTVTTYMTESTPVLSVKYDVRIPDNTVVDTARYFQFDMASGSTVNNDVTKIRVNYENKAFSAAVYEKGTAFNTALKFDKFSNDALNVERNISADYTPDTWVTLETRISRNTENKLEIGIYVGEQQIYFATGSTAYSSLYINRMEWTKDTPTTAVPSHYDDITISAIGEVYRPEKEIDTTKLIDFDFADVTPTSSIIDTNGGTMFTDKNLVQSGATSSSFGTITYSTEDESLSVKTAADGTTSQSVYMLQQARGSVTELVNTGEETVLHSSYDIYIPEGSEASERKQQLNFAGRSISNYGNHTFEITSAIKNGTLTFDSDIYTGVVDEADRVDFTKRSEAVTGIASNTWHTIEYVLRIKYDETDTGYDVKIYGIYNGKCYYEDELNVDGSALGLAGNNRFYIYGTGTGLEGGFETKYDNIQMTHYSEYDNVSAVWTQDYIYPLSLTYDAETGVTAKAKVDNTNGSYNDKLCLIMAVYNGTGALEKMWIDTTLDGEYLEYTSNDSNYVKSGYTAKAFLFDSLQSAVPYVESVTITLP